MCRKWPLLEDLWQEYEVKAHLDRKKSMVWLKYLKLFLALLQYSCCCIHFVIFEGSW